MRLPQLSVIVATWNRPERLDEALKSISLQREAVPFEVIVVNDGGLDISSIAARWARVMPVQAVSLDVNVGLARARNEGIRRAQGGILCFLDDDDIMLAGHLSAAVARLRDEDVDAVCMHVAVCSEFIAAGSAPQRTQVNARYDADFDERLLMICNFIPVNAMFIRRGEAPILFDETLPELEDWELWLRLRQRLGYRVGTVPRTTAVYHRVAGFGSMTSRSRESAETALSFRDTFREITRRFPSSDAVVTEGRSIHDHFYAVLANTCRSGVPVYPFAYERFVECMGAFTRGAITGAEARARIDWLVSSRER